MIVVAWELCWYRYQVDLSERSAAETQAVAQGTELSELEREERVGNAVASEHRHALAVRCLSRFAALAYWHAKSKIVGTMIYCVVPKPLADELYPKLVEHYKDDANVKVIVDRREFDRRARYGRSGAADEDVAQRRVIRDRRRARVAGDLLPLAQAS